MGIVDYFRGLIATQVPREPTLQARWAEIADATEAWELLRDGGAGRIVGNCPHDLLECLILGREMAAKYRGVPVFRLAVATWGEDVIGAACGVLTPQGSQVLWVAVAPSRRRLGVGRELLRLFETTCEYGVRPLAALVPEDRVGASKFFAACGWRVDRRTPLVKAPFDQCEEAIVFLQHNGCDDLLTIRVAE